MHRLTQQGLEQRHAAVADAEQLIALEIEHFAEQKRSLRAKDLICSYRSNMENLAQTELNRAMLQLQNGEPQLEVLREFSQRLIQKFAHTPTMSLRQAAIEQRDEILDLADYLFQPNAMSHDQIS